MLIFRLPRWLSGKESTCRCRRHRFDPWVRKIPRRRKLTPIFLPGKFHGQRSLVTYSPWGLRVRHGWTHTYTHTHTHTHTIILIIRFFRFPDSSVGKESTCNAEDPGLIPGSGRSSGERIGYLLQYSWASFVAQLVKNLPAMWETWVWSLRWEDPLEKGQATHSSILA